MDFRFFFNRSIWPKPNFCSFSFAYSLHKLGVWSYLPFVLGLIYYVLSIYAISLILYVFYENQMRHLREEYSLKNHITTIKSFNMLKG